MTTNTAQGTVIHDIVIGDIDDFERTFQDALRLPPVSKDACVECQIARNLKRLREAGQAVKANVKEQARRDAADRVYIVEWPDVEASAALRYAADWVQTVTGDATSPLSATELREEADGMDAAEALARRRNEAIRVVEELGDVNAATLVAAVIDVMDGVTR